MSSQTIAIAIRDILLDQGITPKTTATVQPASGAIQVTVADASHFVAGGILGFDDTLGEELLPISSVNSTTGVIKLDFTGLGYNSLKYTHGATVGVYTNILPYMPVEPGKMLRLGDPVLFVAEKREVSSLIAVRHNQSTYTMRVGYMLTLIRPPESQMDPNAYSGRQQKKAQSDLETIKVALNTNIHLTRAGSAGENAFDLGSGGRNTPRLTVDWSAVVQSGDMQTFMATLEVLVRDKPQVAF